MFDVLEKFVFTLPFRFMKPAGYWIEHLALQPHPEGGFYRENYRAEDSIARASLPHRFTGARSFSTGIYFLLRSQDFSAFHRIQSDEMWHHYAGSSLTIFVLGQSGLTTHKLGTDLEAGERPQVVIPAGYWFAAQVPQADSYVLAGCTVSPGFDFADFEMAKRDALIEQFPGERELIERLSLA